MNFDLAQPKLIICIECNGYIHDAHEISFEISGTEVLCIYCSLDEAKCYDAHQKQAEAQLNKESKLTTKSKLSSKSSLKNGQLFSAVQLSKIKSSGMKNEELKMLKVISRESIEI